MKSSGTCHKQLGIHKRGDGVQEADSYAEKRLSILCRHFRFIDGETIERGSWQIEDTMICYYRTFESVLLRKTEYKGSRNWGLGS